MSLSFGLLDQSPITSKSSEEAFKHTLELAQLADALGFDRFWVSEHHGSPHYAGTAPEVLIAYLLAKTEQIKIGSGGVLLQHYSPYKIAEIFHVLSALGSGRIELGIGRSPGGLPPSTQALQQKFKMEQDAFDHQLAALLHDLYSGAHQDSANLAYPNVAVQPPVFLLGSSENSAGTASELHLNYVFASFFNNQKDIATKAIQAYQQNSSSAGDTIYSPAVIIAETEQRAKALAEQTKLITIHFKSGKQLIVAREDDAVAFAKQLQEPVDLEVSTNRNIIFGTRAQVSEQLVQISRQLPINGFVFHLAVTDHKLRLNTIRELAQIKKNLNLVTKEAE
ncbi:MsnO8 family LLM class oxidoreductase [Sporolactobacillus terrae]|uniref:MsnO8 family LLM class oxidoreductase n=1 Tax=Sporolactobacillus terrae TaxID=269673 RepID=UPI00048EFA7F|nr:MsnO8 family LLM class oxidoreductase [Sporolactobacillus terrae]